MLAAMSDKHLKETRSRGHRHLRFSGLPQAQEPRNRKRELMIRMLLDARADPNLPDNHGHTPLMMASAAGFKEVVELLLQRGADPSLTDKNLMSAEDVALLNQHHAVVELLKAGSLTS
jgi:ankyrin repeat protein